MSKHGRVLGAPEIRKALRVRLSNEHAEQPDTVFIEEFGICRGQGRIDLAVVNSFMYAMLLEKAIPAQFNTQIVLFPGIGFRLLTILTMSFARSRRQYRR